MILTIIFIMANKMTIYITRNKTIVAKASIDNSIKYARFHHCI